MPASAATAGPSPSDLLLAADHPRATRPVWLVAEGGLDGLGDALTPVQRTWLAAIGFKGQARRHALLPAADGSLAGALLGTGSEKAGAEPVETNAGLLPTVLPEGAYHLAGAGAASELAAVAWGLGAYQFRAFKGNGGPVPPALKLARGLDRDAILNTVEAVWLARDLINRPANDLGPAELEAAAHGLAERHGAKVSSIVGDKLAEQGFRLIHTVGAGSARAPRLVDITWGRPDAPKVTLVGKGICFDSGGLDIKPAAGMLLMKKDMGGAATALAIGHMIMGRRLDVRLRILLAIAENSVSGTSFRPGDIIRSRAGKTVEIGNTDAEGRLVLADALDLADEEAPAHLFCFSTLTGAARVATGLEVAPFYCDDDALSAELAAAGAATGDALWRLPFWSGYESMLDSPVADMNNVSESPFGGSIVAALFLRRFVSKAGRFAHFDIYGWRAAAKPLGPKGGEATAARAVFEVLRRQMSQASGARPGKPASGSRRGRGS